MDPDGGRRDTLRQRLAAVEACGLACGSWDELGAALDGISDQQALNRALGALGPADGAERDQAAALIGERIAELTSGHGSRMLGAAATLGVELQDLDSQIDVADDDGTVLATVIPTSFAGEGAQWRCTADGSNLEFVTEPIGNRFELSQVLAEMVRVYQAMLAGGPGRYVVGGDCFDVRALSGRAQPQYNVEVPLDLLEALVDDLGASAGLYPAFFGVSGKWWKSDDTDEEVRVVRVAAAVIAGLGAGELEGIMAPDALADADAVRTVRGFLLLLAMAAVHQTEFRTRVLKDQPLLHKCNLATVAEDLQDRNLLVDGSVLLALDLLTGRKAVLAPDRAALRQLQWFRGELEKGEDPSWTREGSLLDLNVRSPRWTSKRQRLQVVLELRRVPILAPGTWAAACLAAFDHFVADPARRYN